MSNIEIKKEFIFLQQFPNDFTSCNTFAFCVSPFACNVTGCLCVPPSACIPTPCIISNADFEVIVEDSGKILLDPRPSKVLQYSIISNPCPDHLEVRTFRFLCIENDNKERFLAQYRNTNGILICDELLFSDIDKGKKCR